MAFLTDLDSRAAIKGSRDPLGTQAIWVPLGRKIVGNLTTVTSSVRDFTVVMLGFWFLERARDEGSQQDELGLFLKFEQIAAYARVLSNLGGFRGVDQARLNVSRASKVTVSADRPHQILGNQKIYGLWGLYTVASRSSGLLTDDPMRLTPKAREFVERHYIPAFTKAGFRDGDAIVRWLVSPASRIEVEDDQSKDVALLKTLGKLLRPAFSAAEREFYDEVLVRGVGRPETCKRQTRMASLLQATLAKDDFEFTSSTVGALADKAGDHDEPESLALRLERIRHCESVLAPATRLFVYLLTCHGKQPGDVAATIRKAWGGGLKHLDLTRIHELRDELTTILGDPEAAARWMAIAGDLVEGAYDDLLPRLIAHNKLVMQARGNAAPWIEVREGRLHVAFRDETFRLPERKELPKLWNSSYFLDSLRAVVAQVRGVA